MPIREASIQITAEEHRARCQKLIEYLRVEGLTGVVLFDQDYVLYYSGFAFVATERPMAFRNECSRRAAPLRTAA